MPTDNHRAAHYNVPVRRYIRNPTRSRSRARARAGWLTLTVVGAGRNNVDHYVSRHGTPPTDTGKNRYFTKVATWLREGTRNTVTMSGIRYGGKSPPRLVNGPVNGPVNVGNDVTMLASSKGRWSS